MNKSKSSLAWWLLVFSMIYMVTLRNDLTAARDEGEELQGMVEEYRELMETANSNIADAKAYEGESYGEMAEALANLEEIDIP